MGILAKAKALFKPQARAITQDLGVGAVNSRWSDYPSFNLTPQRLRQILWQADQGDMRYLMELFEEMEEKDGHLGSILQTRKLAVRGLPLEIQPATEKNQRDQEIADFIREQLDGIPDFRSDLLDLLDAIGKGYAATEIFWEYRGKRAVVADLEWIHPKCISFVNSPTPLIITETNKAGEEPQGWKIIFHRYRGRTGDVCRGGMIRPCTLPYLLKSFNWKFWAIFNEIFGMPIRIGKYGKSASDADRKALNEALKSLGSDAFAVISEDTIIEFLEAGKSGGGGKINPYESFIQICNREMSKAILGQTLTTDTSPGSGTLAGNAHEQVRQDIILADAEDLAAVLRDQLVRPLVGFNFGWDVPLPQVLLVSKEAIDFKTETEGIKNLKEAGLKIPARHCYERYGIPKPEEGEEILETAAAPPGDAAPEKAPGQDLPFAAKAGAGQTEILASQRTASIQQELENLTQAANQEAQKYLAQMLAPVRDLIFSGADEQAVKAQLLELYRRIDTRDLEVLMGQVRILAHLRGRMQ